MDDLRGICFRCVESLEKQRAWFGSPGSANYLRGDCGPCTICMFRLWSLGFDSLTIDTHTSRIEVSSSFGVSTKSLFWTVQFCLAILFSGCHMQLLGSDFFTKETSAVPTCVLPWLESICF